MLDALAARLVYQPNGRLIKVNTGLPGDTDINRAGYRRVRWDRGSHGTVRIFAHHLVWYIHKGAIPDDMMVDHWDGDYLNNRIENLRLVTRSGNSQNSVRRGYFLDNRSGKYRSEITLDGVTKRLGYFDTPQEARAAYVAAKALLHECATPRTLQKEIN